MSFRTLIPALLLAACTLRPYTFGDSATDSGTTGDTTTTGTTTVPGPGTSTSTGPASTGMATNTGGEPTTGSDTHSFIIMPDWGTSTKQCDPWIEDCPEGQKCMPYSGDGDSAWESLKCVDVVPNPDGLYEPCMAFGSGVSGEDTCDKHMMCWDVVDGVGYCVAMCVGSPDNPACEDPMASCLISGDGTLTLCLAYCDPLVQNCDPGEVCVPNPQHPDDFRCFLDASGDEGQAFDPCEAIDACDPGLFCAGPDLAAECDPMAIGCCIPFCDISLPNSCPGQGLECLSWYVPGMAPPGYENTGVCGLPTP